METRAAKGGRMGPGNWMNSACISTGCHGSGGGGRRGDGPFPFKDLAAQASMRKAPEAWAPGIQESRPQCLLPRSQEPRPPTLCSGLRILPPSPCHSAISNSQGNLGEEDPHEGLTNPPGANTEF